MRRIAALATALLLLGAVLPPFAEAERDPLPSSGFSVAAQQARQAATSPSCEFRLGFAALRDQIPEIVGDCVENERFNTANGNSEQRTAGGLLVWRKADNWTAFTNGSQSWINGPQGLQSRPNGERFAWEAETSTPAPALQPTAVPTATPARPTPTPAPPRSYTPDVKAMDEQSGGPGVTAKLLMGEITEEWARQWGWMPRRPTTVYLYFDGYRFADGVAGISGRPMAPGDRERFAKTVAGVALVDRRMLGWAVAMNLGYRYGQRDWEIVTKSTLVHEYTHVMQMDVAGAAGPTWFKEGMAEVTSFAKVPAALANSGRLSYVSLALKTGNLPSLRALENWDAIVGAGYEGTQMAYGMSYLAARYLADRVGGMPLRQILERVAAGEGFEAALQSATGFTLDRLDREYRATIPPL